MRRAAGARACRAVVTAAAALLLVAGCGLEVELPDTPASDPVASDPVASGAPGSSAAGVLATLPTRPAGWRPDYDRALFGAPWTDTDRNGCDTRNDVLRRDLRQVALKPGTRDCVVLTGSLPDPYTGADVPFVRGASDLQVDHVVALADAWRAGAHAWPYAKRLAFANDPLELLVTAGAVNQAKGDSTADQWLPPLEDARCAFAARQVAVKVKYELTVTAGERAALARVLQACPGQPAPTGGTPTLAPNREPSPRPST